MTGEQQTVRVTLGTEAAIVALLFLILFTIQTCSGFVATWAPRPCACEGAKEPTP